jgi:predicted transcriptional regulator
MYRHFNNYISLRDAGECSRRGVRKISVTPTALRQTPERNLEFLEKNGIVIEKIVRNGRPKKLSNEQVKKILATRQSKLSFYKISSLTGIAKSTVFDYYKRYSGEQLKEEEVNELQIKEAHKLLKILLERDISEEITELARRGCSSKNINEIRDIMMRIEDNFKSLRLHHSDCYG